MVSSDEGGFENDGALMVTGLKRENSWVMNSRFSYHMCSWKMYFDTLEKRRWSRSTKKQ